MAPSTSSGESFIDGHRPQPWSPPGRPTVNTSFSNQPSLSTQSDELSQHHLSSLPSSSHASPWSPSVPSSSSHTGPYMLQQANPRPTIPGDGASQRQSLSGSEWNNLFSAPLNPTQFAALAANGVLGVSPDAAPNVPSASLQSPHYIPSNSRPQANQHIHGHGQTASWSHSTTPYLSSNPSYMHKSSMTRHSSTINAPNDKEKSSAGDMSHYSPVPPCSHEGGLSYGTKATDERQFPGSIPGDRRQSMRESTSPHNVGPSRHLDSRLDRRNSAFDASLHSTLSPSDYNPGYSFSGERSNIGIPPSLWMSPTSPTPSTPASYGSLHAPLLTAISTTNPADSSALSSYGHSPLSSNHSATDSKSALFNDLFADNLFDLPNLPLPEHGTSSFTSPRLSGSPDLKAAELAAASADPEALAKEDPLATQVWRMYARNKATLPHAQRMENLTWRMMALALKKKKEDEELKAIPNVVEHRSSPIIPKEEPTELTHYPSQSFKSKDHNERGRGRDKVRVVGFDGTNQDGQDGPEDEEYVVALFCPVISY